MRSIFIPLAVIVLAVSYNTKNAKAEDPTTTGSIAGSSSGTSTGTSTGLPIPRFVSLKPSDTPMREGPSKDNAVKWIFKREGLPVEITAEFDNWRRIRDAEGVEGWVFHTRLSGKRNVMVMSMPAQKAEPIRLHSSPTETSHVPAKLQPGVIAMLDNCNKNWCKIKGEDFNGYIKQDRLWGVYALEMVK